MKWPSPTTVVGVAALAVGLGWMAAVVTLAIFQMRFFAGMLLLFSPVGLAATYYGWRLLKVRTKRNVKAAVGVFAFLFVFFAPDVSEIYLVSGWNADLGYPDFPSVALGILLYAFSSKWI